MKKLITIFFISLYINGFSQNIIKKDTVNLISKYSKVAKKQWNLGNYKTAIENYIIAREFAIIKKDTFQIGNTSINIASLYFKINNKDKALQEIYKAELTFTQLKNNKGLSVVYNTLGLINAKNAMFNESINYFKKSLVLYKHKEKRGTVSMNIGNVYIEQNKIKKGLKILDSLLIEIENNKDNYSKTLNFQVLMNIGTVHLDRKNYKKAILYFTKGNNLALTMKNKRLYAYSTVDITRVYMDLEEFITAKKYALKSLNLLKNYKNDSYLQDTYSYLSTISSYNLNYKKALNYEKKHTSIKDSISINNNIQTFTNYKINRKLEKNNFEKEKLKQELILVKEKKKANQLWFAILISALLLVFSLFSLQYVKRTSNKSLLNLNIKLANPQKSINRKINTNSDNSFVLSKEQINKIKDDLLVLMNKDRVFLDNKINAKGIADLLKTNTTYLSKVINIEFQKNFKAFINGYRINEARRLMTLKEYQNYTIEYIAKQTGFNSMSVFNNAFKLETGITPTYFKKHLHS